MVWKCERGSSVYMHIGLTNSYLTSLLSVFFSAPCPAGYFRKQDVRRVRSFFVVSLVQINSMPRSVSAFINLFVSFFEFVVQVCNYVQFLKSLTAEDRFSLEASIVMERRKVCHNRADELVIRFFS